MKVAFRVDASVGVGTGHVMRCLTLAGELRRRGAETNFLCRELPAPLARDMEAGGHRVHLLPPGADEVASTAALEGIGGVSWLVADHYRLDQVWESAMRPMAARIMVIDDLADRRHDCDLLLDQNYSSAGGNPYGPLLPDHASTLLGPRYALLRPEFASARRQANQRDGAVHRVLVCFGGSDPGNHTATVLQALRPHAPRLARIDVVLGAANPHRESIMEIAAGIPGAEIHNPARDLPSLLAAADLAIGAGGIMNWERACLGVPSLVFGIADNQQRGLADLITGGYLVGKPDMRSPDLGLVSAWLQVAFDTPDLLAGLSRRSLELVDGLGARRVADALAPLPSLSFRAAARSDSEAIFAWRNDPAIRTISLDTREISRDSHSAWFQRTLADPDRLLLIAEDGDQPVGVVRFDLEGDEALISVYRVPTLPPGKRGLIGQATEWLHNRHPRIRRIKAEVLPGNTDSLAAFLAAGYREAKRVLAIELEPS